MTPVVADQLSSGKIDDLLQLLKRNYSKLGIRIRTLEHQTSSSCLKTNIRVHYPALRDGKATIEDLVRLLSEYIVSFALPRREIDAIRARYGKIPAEEYDQLVLNSMKKAKDLFKKANKATNRNGEAGELLLYLLTEWVLEAPQLLAKMPLKTNPNMPVHGSDGIHIRYSNETGKLSFLWGESKLHSSVYSAIEDAAVSIADALSDSKLSHEFNLISRNIDFSGLSDSAKAAILSYLDPNDEHSNERINVTTCLIGFDFMGYAALSKLSPTDVESTFKQDVLAKLPALSDKLAKAMTNKKIEDEHVEVFFFPVPSVQHLRDLFQTEIGWHQ